MSNDTSKQTLFRFVSLRNPQLTNNKQNENKGFIQRESIPELEGLFDIEINNWYSLDPTTRIKKIVALEKLAASKTNDTYFYNSEQDVKQQFSDYVKLGELIVKNEELTAPYINLTTLSNLDLKKLWDNLIFQVVTQKDFYVKEDVILVLKANHYLKNRSSVDIEVIKNSKVVLPIYLFIDEANKTGNNNSLAQITTQSESNEQQAVAFTVGESSISDSYINLSANQVSNVAERRLTSIAEKNTELALATSEKSRLDILREEMQKVKSSYDKEYSAALSQAQKDYQASIKPLQDSYNASLQAIRNTFTPSQTEEERQLLLDTVAEPIFPEFTFSFPPLNQDYFAQKLSSEVYAIMLDVLNRESLNNIQSIETTDATEKVAKVLPEYNMIDESSKSYEEIYDSLDQQHSNYSQKILENSSQNNEQFISIGGVVIPQQTVISKHPFTFALTPKINRRAFLHKYDFDLVLDLPDSSWEVESIDCTVKNNNGIVYTDSPKVFTQNDSFTSINNIFNDKFSLTELHNINHFSAIVYFKNNREATITVDVISMDITTKVGNIILKPQSTNTQIVGGEKKVDAPFITKNFGIKSLGIAEYLKVEQSLHGYVPGEVAHIENIMAREYKQKSTRRLSKSDNTNTSSSSVEREKTTDTSSTKRFEMQNEVSRVLQQDMALEAHAAYGKNRDGNGTGWSFDIGGSFAYHRSREDAMRQASTRAQEITSKALDKLVTKISEERVEKIIEEYEENNMHGFDNRNGDKNVTGVYRWVDKKMKNQIYNYGKRMMFEFMIPQPAKLHQLAIGNVNNSIASTSLVKPQDPRTAVAPYTLSDYNAVTEQKLQYWANLYKVEVDKMPLQYKTQSEDITDVVSSDRSLRERPVTVPENYLCKTLKVNYSFSTGNGWAKARVKLNNFNGAFLDNTNETGEFPMFSGLSFENTFNISYYCRDVRNIAFHLNLGLEIKPEVLEEWKKENFKKIIEAYDNALKDYEEKVKAEEDKLKQKKESQDQKLELTQFYRQIEENVLKHNCIAYMIDPNNFGKLMYKGTSMSDYEVLRNDLDAYAATVKFMEQAFEWTIMDYKFYPYYWGAKTDWVNLYQAESIDPLFRSFLQSGMARVIVTVKPGFEDAVQFFMATRKIWNGGEVPVLGDPLYLSIVDELREPVGEPQGKPWITRIPTSLNILQAESIGLKVESALPWNREDPTKFENPDEVIVNTNFESTKTLLGSGSNRFIENVDINNGNLQLTTDTEPREVVAEISMESLKRALDNTTYSNPQP